MNSGMLDRVCWQQKQAAASAVTNVSLCRACYRNGTEKSSGVKPAHPGGVAASEEASRWHRRELRRRPAGARAEPLSGFS